MDREMLKDTGTIHEESSSKSKLLNHYRLMGGIVFFYFVFLLYENISMTGKLYYYFIPFTYNLAGYFNLPWPFSITLIFPILLCSIFNLALWFPCRYGYIFITSFLIAVFGLIAHVIIAVTIQFLRFFVAMGDPNVLPSLGRILAPFFFGIEVTIKGGLCYLLYSAIKKWSKNNIRAKFGASKVMLKKEGIVGAGILLLLLGCTIQLEKCASGTWLIPSQVRKDKLEITFDFKRQDDWKNNQFAIWMEEFRGTSYIKTIYVSKDVIDRNAEKKLLPRWSKTVEAAGESRKDLEKVAKPVPQSGKLTYLWDGTDRYGSKEYEIEGEGDTRKSIICYIECYGGKNEYALYSGIYSGGDGTSCGFVGTPDGKICEKTENKTIRNIEGHFRGAHVTDYEKKNAWINAYGLIFR